MENPALTLFASSASFAVFFNRKGRRGQAKIFLAINPKLHYIFSIAYAALTLRNLILPNSNDRTDSAAGTFRVNTSSRVNNGYLSTIIEGHDDASSPPIRSDCETVRKQDGHY